MASLVLYGDLAPLLNDNRAVDLSHAVESMKLLPPRGFPATQPPSYGFVTQGAVASVEVERANIPRTFCLAVSAADFPPDRPSTWSGALDQIASGAMPGDAIDGAPASARPKRLLLVAVGNVLEGTVAEVSQVHALEDPAQSWNSLSVGGFTTKATAPHGEPTKRPVVAANQRSPFSRGSQDLPYDLTPIKPEVLFEAGNMVSRDNYCDWHPAVSLLAAGSEAAAPLVPFWATSAATGMAGNFLGRLKASLPGLWPETYRAIVVDSARWPGPIQQRLIGRGNHWKTGSKGAKQEVLREVGYGVPDFERAVMSARNDVTMIAQQEIQPFASLDGGRSAVFNEMHLYDLPWPKQALEALENEVVTMKVTLSYFIEPNISGKAATRPETYRSFGLRFAIKKRTETEAQFRTRVGAAQKKAGDEAAGTESDCWLLGPKAVQAGSLHCDLWRGHAIDLAGHDAIAVYPVGGWWKTHLGQRRTSDKARYALTVSISAPAHQVDLYTEIAQLVELRAKEIEAAAARIEPVIR